MYGEAWKDEPKGLSAEFPPGVRVAPPESAVVCDAWWYQAVRGLWIKLALIGLRALRGKIRMNGEQSAAYEAVLLMLERL